MSAFSPTDRQLIPRWKPFSLGIQTREIMPLAGFPKGKNPEFEERLRRWKIERDCVLAAEIVGGAILFRQHDQAIVQSAAEFLLHDKNSTRLNILSARQVLDIPEADSQEDFLQCETTEQYGGQIRILRQRLRKFEKDPTRWSDLGFFYAALGKREKAKRCMITAHELARENRFIARSASRFFLHIGEGDRALAILRHSLVEVEDPWVIAAEIAISQSLGTRPLSMDKGVRILTNNKFQPIHISELAGEIGTVEFKNGSRKKGRQRFSKALIDPTENTVAQAEWLVEEIGQEIIAKIPQVELQFEADATRFLNLGQFKNSIEACLKWHCLQPFSARPGILASYGASIGLGDHGWAIEIAEKVRLASPDSSILRNNLAFAFASRGDIGNAEAELRGIDLGGMTPHEKTTVLATRGLLEFRRGNPEIGREAYREAINFFRREGAEKSRILARIMLFREENRISKEMNESELGEIEEDLKRMKNPELNSCFERVKKDLKGKTSEFVFSLK